MKLQVAKNIQFTRLIKADGRLREFNFRKLAGLQEGIFSVDVADERGNRLLFKMHEQDYGWKIAEEITEIPDWVLTAIPVLHEKIEEVMHDEVTGRQKDEP